jgi:hypothetical protein
MRAIFRGLGFIGKAFFALVGLIIVIGVIAAIAGSKGSTPTGPTNSPQLVTSTEAKTQETTSTPTETKEAPPPERPQTFRGAGTENLGTITVTSPSTLEWTCRGCLVFGVNGATSDYAGTIGIASSNRSSGVTAVEPGTYKSVNVIADEGESNAGWSISIHGR